ncbi:MAG: WD40/YVTN/BNR-like repeat-containing protein [Wenzhouxiangella sp.]
MSTVPAVAVLIATRKGLFIARSDARRSCFELEGPHMAGFEIQRAFLDPRWGGQRGFAAAHHPIWGIHVYRTDDGGRQWYPLSAVPSHGEDDHPDHLKTIWNLAPGPEPEPEAILAGIEPPGLFKSRDGGHSWDCLPGFHTHPTASRWHPAKGGCAVHSLAARGTRLFAALAAGGIYRSDDQGESWQNCNSGIRAPYLAESDAPAGQNDHTLRVHPADPNRLYRQSHCGTWRSDDGGEHWTEITAGLPSDFGYALGLDPADPDTLFTIPEESSQFRTTVGGRLRVYRTENAGADWQPLTDGLPQANCFVTVLRDGLDTDGLQPLGVYFGTSSGQVYYSIDRGDHWQALPATLPPILSIQAGTIT